MDVHLGELAAGRLREGLGHRAQFKVAGEERRALRSFERVEKGTKTGTLEPLHYGAGPSGERRQDKPQKLDKPLDPNSPFAALLALKAELEAKQKGDKK